jgi:glycosyltransferase involved in cell wall biosynthesis
VSDRDLAALHSDALALVLPSLSEGFGRPALEAMSCGAPVLAAHDGAVLEVAGAAGLGFDPYKVADMRDAIVRIATDEALRQQLRAAAIPETARNTWPLAAELTIAALECTGRRG